MMALDRGAAEPATAAAPDLAPALELCAVTDPLDIKSFEASTQALEMQAAPLTTIRDSWITAYLRAR